MSLYDRLVPAEALRFDRAHPMTAGWSFAYDNAGAFYLESLPPHVHFMRTGEYATGGVIPKAQPHPLTQADFPLIRLTPPRFSWLPWRKRR